MGTCRGPASRLKINDLASLDSLRVRVNPIRLMMSKVLDWLKQEMDTAGALQRLSEAGKGGGKW